MIGRIGFRLPGIQPAWFLLAVGAASPALAQQLEREIAFVRALARDMRFIELARLEAERLAAEFRSGTDQDKIAQLAVEVAYYGANSRSDRAQRRTLFKETIEKCKQLIETSSDPGVQIEARATLANASQEFGQFLIEELEIAREEAPDRAKELAAEATAVFRAGIEACDRVQASLKEKLADEQKRVEYYLMWMKKAVLTREQGRADRENRGVLVGRAIEELEELVLDVGEETAIGLRGLFEIAQCREVDGKIPEAIASYRGTISQIATSLQQAQEGELDLTGEMQGFLFEMMQEVYVRTGEVMVREGAPGTAELFAEFRKNMAAFGEKGVDLFDVVSDQYGHLMLLAECRFLAESGDPKKVGDALAMAQRINDKHPNDYVGVRAKAVLRDILAVQRNLVSGELLFEVAKGEMQNKNYEEAIKGLRRALAAMNADEQNKYGLQAYEMMGLSFAYTERYLEAMVALTEGLKRFKDVDKARAGDVADAADRALSVHKRLTRNDPALEGFWRQVAEQIAGSSETAGAKLFWKEGNDKFNDKQYAEAAAAYAKVTPDYVYYEQAQVRRARAQSAVGDFAAARKTIADYRAWADSNTIPASDTGKLQVRTLAMVEAEFTEVQMAYLEARGDEGLKLVKDLTKYPAAVDKAQSFVTNFAKDGEAMLPTVFEYLGRLQTDLARLDRAEEAYTQLKQKDAPRASRLATEIFREYQNQVKLLTDELDQAIAGDKGEAAIDKAMADVNAMRTKLVALGMDYIAGSPKPQLAILVATMLSWELLGDWKRVDEVAQKTLELYGADATDSTKKTVDLLVRPKIGEALLQQKRFDEAYKMLVEAEKANPTQWELKRQIARALGGWFEFSRTGTPTKVPGMERAAEAYEKYYGEYRTWALRPDVRDYSLDWYRFHWEAYWFALQAGQKDSKFKGYADTLYRKARSTDDFATLKTHGAEGLLLFKYFQLNRNL